MSSKGEIWSCSVDFEEPQNVNELHTTTVLQFQNPQKKKCPYHMNIPMGALIFAFTSVAISASMMGVCVHWYWLESQRNENKTWILKHPCYPVPEESGRPNVGKRQGMIWVKFGWRQNKSGSSGVLFQLWSQPEDTKARLGAVLPQWITNENREKNLSGDSPWYHQRGQIATTDWGWVGCRRKKKEKIKTDKAAV